MDAKVVDTPRSVPLMPHTLVSNIGLTTCLEAALAKSLLFQFADGLVVVVDLLSQVLNSWVSQDPRYLSIGLEVKSEARDPFPNDNILR